MQIENSSRNYKALAEQWIPEIETTDLIFIPHHWAATPIFYYLSEARYHFVNRSDFEEASNLPGSRLWVMYVSASARTDKIKEALKDYYHIQRRIDAYYVWVVLYAKN